MEIILTPDQEAFVRQAIKTGRIDRAEDAVTEALLLWEERELLRAELVASIDDARDSIIRGEGRIITQEAMQALAAAAKQRLRAHLAAEEPAAS
jgi:Arc/MetJ-type ribon-helix-helix transcriptional regulator